MPHPHSPTRSRSRSRSRTHPCSHASSRPLRRHPTLYDAAASLTYFGGFTQGSFPRSDQQSIHTAATTESSHPSTGHYHRTLRSADEILGRRRAKRYLLGSEEELLPYEDNSGLPDGDLLKAVHQYAGEFYHKLGLGMVASRGMDETALLAVGTLIEESVREALGECGYGAFIDQGEEDEELEEVIGGNEEGGEDRGGEDEPEFSENNQNGDRAPEKPKPSPEEQL